MTAELFDRIAQLEAALIAIKLGTMMKDGLNRNDDGLVDFGELRPVSPDNIKHWSKIIDGVFK